MPKWDPTERMVRGLRAEGAGFKPSVPHIINGAEIRGFCAAVPEVRIHLPPAESQVRTCLSRELPSYVEKSRFFAGVRAGASGAVGRDAQDAATSGPRAVIS